jgi:hypothetical protein
VAESGRVYHLPIGRGSLAYMALRCVYQTHEGWFLHVLHRHDGEKDLCPTYDKYDSLTLDELVDVVAEIVATAHYPFKTTADGGCRPDPPVTGGGGSAA